MERLERKWPGSEGVFTDERELFHFIKRIKDPNLVEIFDARLF